MPNLFRFVTDAVKQFEYGSADQNQYGNHIWTPELEELYGAQKGNTFIGRDADGNPAEYHYAYYDDPQTGEEASDYIVGKLWQNAGNDSIRFASNYTGLPPDDPTVKNYAKQIEINRKDENAKNAVQRFNNYQEASQALPDLIAENPSKKSQIEKLVETGYYVADQVRGLLAEEEEKKKPEKEEKKQGKDFEDHATEFGKSFMVGVGQLGETIGGGLQWAEENFDTDLNAQAVRDYSQGIIDDYWIPELNKEFEWSDMATPEFYTTKFSQNLPNLLALMIPGMGAGGIAGKIGLKLGLGRGLTTVGQAVTGALASRPLESAMEASQVYTELRDQGVRVEDASRGASETFKKNLSLIGLDAVQFGLAFSGLNKVFRPSMVNFIKGTGKIGVASGIEGGEELVQLYFSEAGKASALGQPDPDLVENLSLATPTQKEAFALGAFMGGTFQTISAIGGLGGSEGEIKLTKEQIENIIEEETEKLTILQAREQATQEPITPEQEEASNLVNSLENYPDVTAEFVEQELVDIMSEEDLINAGYPVESFDLLNIEQVQEGEEGYVEGQTNYRVGVEATNYEHEDTGQRRILFSGSTSRSGVIEDTVEAILTRLDKVNPNLKQRIDAWIQRVERTANELGESLPFTGNELFSKAFTYNTMGYGNETEIPFLFTIPEALVNDVIAEFGTKDGTNLLEQMRGDAPVQTEAQVGELAVTGEDIQQDVAEQQVEAPPTLEAFVSRKREQHDGVWTKELAKEARDEYRRLFKQPDTPMITEGTAIEEPIVEEKPKAKPKKKDEQKDDSVYTAERIEKLLSDSGVKALNNVDGLSEMGSSVPMKEVQKLVKKYNLKPNGKSKWDMLKAIQNHLSKPKQKYELGTKVSGVARVTKKNPSGVAVISGYNPNTGEYTFEATKSSIDKGLTLKEGEFSVPDESRSKGIKRFNNFNKLPKSKRKQARLDATTFRKNVNSGKYDEVFGQEILDSISGEQAQQDYKFEKIGERLGFDLSKGTERAYALPKIEELLEKVRRGEEKSFEQEALDDLDVFLGEVGRKEGFKISPKKYISTEEAWNRLKNKKPILRPGEKIEDKHARKIIKRIETMSIKDLASIFDNNDDVSTILVAPRFWYREDIADMFKEASKTDPNIYEKQSLFLTILGILSNGNNPQVNYQQAFEMLQNIKGKKLPLKSHVQGKNKEAGIAFGGLTEAGFAYGTVRWRQVGKSGQVLQKIIDEYGVKGLDKFLLKKFKAKDLKKKYSNLNTYGEGGNVMSHIETIPQQNKEVYGAEVFGRKLGTFIVNMHGIHEDAVIDVWMDRMLSRYTGMLKKFKTESSQNAKDYLDQALKNVADRMTEITGVDWGIDQVQAVLWYNEKEMYIKAGVKPEKGVSYAQVAKQQRALSTSKSDEGSVKDGKRNVLGGKPKISGETSQGRTKQPAFKIGFRTPADQKPNVSNDYSNTSKHFDSKVPNDVRKEARQMEKEYAPSKFRDFLNTFYSQVKRINPAIANAFRRFQRNNIKIVKDFEAKVKPYANFLKKMSRRQWYRPIKWRKHRVDYMILKKALLNGDRKMIDQINAKYGMEDAYNASREALDNIHEQAGAVGLDIGFIQEYFPRLVANPRQYMIYIRKTLGKDSSLVSKIDETIRDEQAKRKDKITDEEKAVIAQHIIKGHTGRVSVGRADNAKARQIDYVADDALRFYHDPHIAIMNYAHSFADMISASQFLGGSPNRYSIRSHKLGKKRYYYIYDELDQIKMPGPDGLKPRLYKNRKGENIMKRLDELRQMHQQRVGLPNMNLYDQIGGMMIRMRNQHGLNADQESRLLSLFEAYFNRNKMSPFVQKFKHLSYIDTMGSPFSAITQLGDLGVAVYRSSKSSKLGYLSPLTYGKVLKNFIMSMLNKSNYSMEDMGIDPLGLEFRPDATWSGKLLDMVFTITGVRKMDQVGKETYVNTVMNGYKKQANIKNPKNKRYKDLVRRLKQKFEPQEVQQLLKDLKNGNRSELVELLAYSELLDIQPVARSEVPVQYLKMTNGRIFYMLKTFMLKRFDIFKKEIDLIERRAQEFENNKQFKRAKIHRLAKGRRLIALGTVIALAEAGTDKIKDIILGREVELSDRVLSNLLKLVGISRYHFYNFSRDGLRGALIKMIMFPVDWIDDPIRDASRIRSAYERHSNKYDRIGSIKKDIGKRGLRSIKHIPFIGKYLYWWNPEHLGPIPNEGLSGSLGYGRKMLEREAKKKKKYKYNG
jgi:hypothetical protein